MKKIKYEVQSGALKAIVEAISPAEALVIAIRHQKFPDLSSITRFRNLDAPRKRTGSKKNKEWLWRYQSTLSLLEGFGLTK